MAAVMLASGGVRLADLAGACRPALADLSAGAGAVDAGLVEALAGAGDAGEEAGGDGGGGEVVVHRQQEEAHHLLA